MSTTTPQQITDTMQRVADWQLAKCDLAGTIAYAKIDPYASKNWIRGCFLVGLSALYRRTREPALLTALLDRCEMNQWQLGLHDRFADDQCIAQTYIELYEDDPRPERIAAAKRALDAMVDKPLRGPDVGWRSHLNWDWADALFMAPPVLTRLAKVTGDNRYNELLEKLWWDTTELLYDPAEQLFYRDARFVVTPGTPTERIWIGPHNGKPHKITQPKLSANGQKVFWGRGNGWVVGGLARLLEYLPADHPTRSRYEELLCTMLARIAGLQAPDGFWRASLLDSAQYPNPESSSTGFFCYAYLWCINQGLLPREHYLPVAMRAWDALMSATDQETGKLGWVQPVGADPDKTQREDSHEYGTGALLLAGCELCKLLETSPAATATLQTTTS